MKKTPDHSPDHVGEPKPCGEPTSGEKRAPNGDRPALRLVKLHDPETAAKHKNDGKAANQNNNSFVRFMNAYADAIDRDIQAILDL